MERRSKSKPKSGRIAFTLHPITARQKQMWPTVVAVLGIIATLVTILVPLLTFGYSSLKSHITKEIERSLNDTTIERRVADKLTERMLEASRVITDSESALSTIHTNMNRLRSEESEASLLSESVRDKLERATVRNRNIEALQINAESVTLSLTDKIGSTDPEVVAKARALIDLVEQESLPANLLIELQTEINDIKENAVRKDWSKWSNDFELCSIRSPSEGGTHWEQPPEIMVDPFGNVHLRGNIMRAMGWEDVATSKEILDLNRPIEMSFYEYDYGSLLDVVMFIPSEYAPGGIAKFVVDGYPNRPKVVEVDSHSFAEGPDGTHYIAVLCRDWFEICIDGVSWTPRDPKAAIERFRRHIGN